VLHEIGLLRTESCANAIAKYNDRIYIVNNEFTLFKYDEKDFKLLSQLRFLPKKTPVHAFSKGFSFAPKAMRMIAPFGQSPMGLLCDISSKVVLLEKLDGHEKTIEVSTFSPKCNYFALGDAAGRSIVYDAESFNYITSLLPRPDYIGCLRFSDDDRYYVSSAFDKTTIVFDLVLNIEVQMFNTVDVVEDVKFFDNNRSIAMILRNGAFQIYHLATKELENPKNIFVGWPSSLELTADERHAIVGLKTGTLTVVELETKEIVITEKISEKGISVLYKDDNTLYIGRYGAETIVSDMGFLYEEFDDAIKAKEYANISKMVKRNIFLTLHKNYDAEMLELYDTLLKDVYIHIEKGDIEKAKELMEPHSDNLKIMKMFEQVLRSESYIKTLITFVKNKKFTEAFAILEKMPQLAEIPAAVQLERHWQQVFSKAKQACIRRDATGMREAKELLTPFSRIPSKQNQINALLKDVNVFLMADKLVAAKKFKEYFALTEKAPFLKENLVYKNIVNLGQEVLKKLKYEVSVNNFQKAKEYMQFLLPYPNMKNDLKTMKEQIVARIQFFDAARENNISKIFALVKEHPKFRYFPEYEKIEEKFKGDVKRSLDLCFKGDVLGVKKVFEPYKSVELFYDKIASMVKIAYLNEMKNARDDLTVVWDKVFDRYIGLFGKHDELVHTAKQLEKIELVISSQVLSNPTGYLAQELPDSILR